MVFEWDPAKSAHNLFIRGFDFGAACQIFAGPTLERTDRREDYGEERRVALGEVAGQVLTVVFTDRRDRDGAVIRRIISARRSNRHERRLWEEARGGA